MRYNQLIENDDEEEHQKALQDTGFWGRAGAGCIFIAKDTGRILLNHRSKYVEQPGTWGVWGGAIDSNESPIQAVKREAQEESGYTPDNSSIILIYVFHDQKSGFKYYNFIVLTPNEFKPNIPIDSQWETQGWEWVTFGDWPSPLHFGVTSILNDTKSLEIIKKYTS